MTTRSPICGVCLKWGRTLARHGALTRDPARPVDAAAGAPAGADARFGARIPATPDYATALVAIGPAAIKLGQALSTRPDLVGEKAAQNLSQLQDDLPPAPFAEISRPSRAPSGHRSRACSREFDEVPVGAASIAQVHRAVTTEGRDVAVKVLRPGIEEEFAKAIETYEWAAAHVERYGGEAQRFRPRLVVAHFRQWTARELDLQREAASASELARIWSRSQAITFRRSIGAAPPAGCSHWNGLMESSSTTARP